MDMASTDGETVPGWNVRYASAVTAAIPLLWSDGTSSGATETFTPSVRDFATNTAGATTGNNSGVFPDTVLKSNFFTSSATDCFLTNKAGPFDTSKTYRVVATGSRSPAPSPARVALFTLAGLASQTIAPQTVDVGLNTSLAAIFTGCKPSADGYFTLTSKVSSGQYVHFCGWTIQEETA